MHGFILHHLGLILATMLLFAFQRAGRCLGHFNVVQEVGLCLIRAEYKLINVQRLSGERILWNTGVDSATCRMMKKRNTTVLLLLVEL
jgi:hypothetical protein